MELAAKNEQNGANLKTGPTATMAGATAGMPATVSGDMRVCQKSGTHGRWQRQRDLGISHGRLGEDKPRTGLRAAHLGETTLGKCAPAHRSHVLARPSPSH